MCNLYNLNPSVKSHFEAFDSAGDPANTLAVEKDYAAPGKPGYLISFKPF